EISFKRSSRYVLDDILYVTRAPTTLPNRAPAVGRRTISIDPGSGIAVQAQFTPLVPSGFFFAVLGSALNFDSSSTVCDAKWRQLVDSTQGDASRREILVSRRLSQIAENRPCYPQLSARS